MTDTTTPDEPETAENPVRGKLLRFGLKNGQTIIVLTTEPVEQDCGLLVVKADSGDTMTIKDDEVAWIRSSEIDMPTEAEIDAYEEKLKAKPLDTGLNVNSFDAPSAASAIRELAAYGQGQYL